MTCERRHSHRLQCSNWELHTSRRYKYLVLRTNHQTGRRRNVRSKSLGRRTIDHPSTTTKIVIYGEHDQKPSPLLLVEWVGVLLRFLDAPRPVNLAGVGAATNTPRFSESSSGVLPALLLQSEGNLQASA
jgi:hypothetical protein